MKVRVVTRCVEHICKKQLPGRSWMIFGQVGETTDEILWTLSQPNRAGISAKFCPLCGEALPQTLGEAEVDGEG